MDNRRGSTRNRGALAAPLLLVLALIGLFASGGPAPAQVTPSSSSTSSTAGASSSSSTLLSSSGAPQQAKAGPGDILVTQLREGSVSVITTGEQTKTVV